MKGRQPDDLSLVNTVGRDCLIYRETTGCYVVKSPSLGRPPSRVASLPCAYAVCRNWEWQEESASALPAPP